MNRPWLVVGAVVVFGIGVGVGVASSGSSGEPTIPTESSEEVVPQACLDAVAEARRLGLITAQFAEISAANSRLAALGIEAVASSDMARLNELTRQLATNNDQVDSLTDEINESTFAPLASECEEAA